MLNFFPKTEVIYKFIKYFLEHDFKDKRYYVPTVVLYFYQFWIFKEYFRILLRLNGQ
jgi:hypothetical protein